MCRSEFQFNLDEWHVVDFGFVKHGSGMLKSRTRRIAHSSLSVDTVFDSCNFSKGLQKASDGLRKGLALIIHRIEISWGLN